ncbi:hypothetical protein [Sporomusa sp. KB1]|jgi:hypothetical protein|nr:hypothetical protein [Sporomusa sp. KB1]TWH48411.1 hypothetical protein Salpa_4564 [Sporomusa sp. KB1]
MIKVLGRILFLIISMINPRFGHTKKKVKEVVNVKYPVYKKAG